MIFIEGQIIVWLMDYRIELFKMLLFIRYIN